MDIGDRIRELRKKKGLNQNELAEAVGVSVDSVRRWEGKKQFPRTDELSNLAFVFCVHIEELLNGPATENWELKMMVRKTKEGGAIDMTTTKSSAVLNIGDDAMSITLSAGYELWEDDAKFEELMAELRKKRAVGLKTRREDW